MSSGMAGRYQPPTPDAPPPAPEPTKRRGVLQHPPIRTLCHGCNNLSFGMPPAKRARLVHDGAPGAPYHGDGEPPWLLRSKALELDHAYARLVKGAASMVKMDSIWVPSEEHTQQDKAEITELVSSVIKKVFEEEVIEEAKRVVAGAPTADPGAEDERSKKLFHVAVGLRRTIMKSWEKAETFRVGDVVHMVECDILDRLVRDGAVQPVRAAAVADDNERPDQLRRCFFMRRSPVLRYQFAMAVGKRLMSQTIVSTQRAQLVEHHRAARWAEDSYATLWKLMKTGGGSSHFSQSFPRGNLQENVLTVDYVYVGPQNSWGWQYPGDPLVEEWHDLLWALDTVRLELVNNGPDPDELSRAVKNSPHVAAAGQEMPLPNRQIIACLLRVFFFVIRQPAPEGGGEKALEAFSSPSALALSHEVSRGLASGTPPTKENLESEYTKRVARVSAPAWVEELADFAEVLKTMGDAWDEMLSKAME